ncbi:hypothetical protein [Cysteiniphilum halobium]|uniref:hypothetical protein n=1 Tax=Cysteiniphilum halobium TaxID=2219059 RepID=UPI003F87671C
MLKIMVIFGALIFFTIGNATSIPNDHPLTNGFRIAIGNGYWSMRQNKADVLTQTYNTDRSDYYVQDLDYGWMFGADNWQSVHYGAGIRIYNFIKNNGNAVLPVPELYLSKYLSQNLSFVANFGSLIYLYDIGLGSAYNLNRHLSVSIQAQYMPSIAIMGHNHNINGLGVLVGLTWMA